MILSLIFGLTNYNFKINRLILNKIESINYLMKIY